MTFVGPRLGSARQRGESRSFPSRNLPPPPISSISRGDGRWSSETVSRNEVKSGIAELLLFRVLHRHAISRESRTQTIETRLTARVRFVAMIRARDWRAYRNTCSKSRSLEFRLSKVAVADNNDRRTAAGTTEQSHEFSVNDDQARGKMTLNDT